MRDVLCALCFTCCALRAVPCCAVGRTRARVLCCACMRACVRVHLMTAAAACFTCTPNDADDVLSLDADAVAGGKSLIDVLLPRKCRLAGTFRSWRAFLHRAVRRAVTPTKRERVGKRCITEHIRLCQPNSERVCWARAQVAHPTHAYSTAKSRERGPPNAAQWRGAVLAHGGRETRGGAASDGGKASTHL